METWPRRITPGCPRVPVHAAQGPRGRRRRPPWSPEEAAAGGPVVAGSAAAAPPSRPSSTGSPSPGQRPSERGLGRLERVQRRSESAARAVSMVARALMVWARAARRPRRRGRVSSTPNRWSRKRPRSSWASLVTPSCGSRTRFVTRARNCMVAAVLAVAFAAASGAAGASRVGPLAVRRPRRRAPASWSPSRPRRSRAGSSTASVAAPNCETSARPVPRACKSMVAAAFAAAVAAAPKTTSASTAGPWAACRPRRTAPAS
mmetsp:Transcript_72653/g.201474  ORF Transcript_72653/g.201474 Transcript_72653/m.201474 type:complete len:261 (+) Transcript_72653:453-1235(+)